MGWLKSPSSHHNYFSVLPTCAAMLLLPVFKTEFRLEPSEALPGADPVVLRDRP